MSRFVEQHRGAWRHLDALLRRADLAGLRSFSPAELEDLARLYRQAISHLAQARTQREEPEVARYLNDLVARAHGRIYAARRRRLPRPGVFFLRTFPQTFRRTIWFTLLAATLFYGAGVATFLAVRANPTTARSLLDEKFTRYLDNFMEEEDAASKYFGTRTQGVSATALSSFLMTNNIQVAFMTFAGGATAGLVTLYALITNGMMLGVFLGMAENHGQMLEFVAIVAPHGMIELSAICIAGAAGLRMAYGLLDPGDVRRVEALARAAKDAVVLALGAAPLLVVAGIIEGFVAPSGMDMAPRCLIGAMTGVVLLAYLLLCGHGPATEELDEEPQPPTPAPL